jgi:N-acetyl-anhydromuramyl-L-alanine amidase AmpD
LAAKLLLFSEKCKYFYKKNQKFLAIFEQKLALFDLLTKLKLKYKDAFILGHRDISPDLNHNGVVDPWEYIKACPCLNAMEEYMEINKIG